MLNDVLRTGWSPQKVEVNYFGYVAGLVTKGVTFKHIEPQYHSAVQALIRTYEKGSSSYSIPSTSGGIVAMDDTGDILGAIILGAAKFGPAAKKQTTVVIVEHVVVTSAWRKRGLGHVLIQMSPMVQTFDLQVGACDPAASKFYERGGFTVLKPGVPLPAGFAREGAAWGNSNPYYTSWFFRSWHLTV